MLEDLQQYINTYINIKMFRNSSAGFAQDTKGKRLIDKNT